MAEVLRHHGFTAQKRFGQNFLTDSHVLEKIIRVSGISSEDFVLEIGPGIGTLTQYLASAGRQVVAVEIDKKLIPILSETLSGWDNATVLCQDILKTDLHGLVREYNKGDPICVVANLPYYITTPVIMKLLESRIPLKSMTIMLQREVAQRICAKEGSADYGALSLSVQYYADPQILARVPENCFFPRPKVESAVLRLDLYQEPPIRPRNEALFFSLVKAAFGQRRKTLANSIKNDDSLPFGREEVEKALNEMELSSHVRGEVLSLAQFVRLSDLLNDF